MSLIARIVLLVLAIPFVLAHGDDCGKNQFKWDAKNVCLPKGGPSNPSKPPANTDCPFNWSWHSGKGCCAPHQPPNTLPPPQCDKGWKWTPGSLCCNPPPTPPPTPPKSGPPTPSRVPGNGHRGDGDNDHDGNGHGHNHKRASLKNRSRLSRDVSLCPKNLSACPVSGLTGGEYECVDTVVDLDNCGGCAVLRQGENCNAIPGVWNVGCEQSACKIYTCAGGYMLSRDGQSCIPL